MVDDSPNNVLVLEKSGKIQFINSNTQTLLMNKCDGRIPDNFLDLVSEYDKDRFIDCLNESYKSIDPRNVQIRLASLLLYSVNKNKSLSNSSDMRKSGVEEIFEMQFTQTRWENKKCIMICFHTSDKGHDLGTTYNLQSQSIIHQINDLVQEICTKYERSKNIDSKCYKIYKSLNYFILNSRIMP